MNQLIDAPSLAAASIQNIQQQSGAVAIITMKGTATRAGYKIQPPQVWKFAGKDVTPLGGRFGQKVVGAATVPIVGAWWELRFAVPSIGTAAMDMPPTPTLFVQG